MISSRAKGLIHPLIHSLVSPVFYFLIYLFLIVPPSALYVSSLVLYYAFF